MVVTPFRRARAHAVLPPARAALPRSLRSIGACLSLASGLLACAGGDPRAALEVDCSVTDDYDVRIIQRLEAGMPSWFAFGDTTPGSVDVAPELRPIPEGRCDSAAALVLTSSRHQDWGSGFGDWMMPMTPADATGYEGVSFWARATGFGKSRGFVFNINDRNTNVQGMVCEEPMAEDVIGGGYTYNEAGMIVPLGGELPSPGDCGNVYQRPVLATQEWYFYRLPFESFLQTANPNRISTGIDRSGLYQFTINIPKDSNIELWLDDIGVYRKREPAAASTGQAPEASN